MDSRSPEGAGRRSPGLMIAVGLIRAYQYSFSLFMGRGCRYAPTCSSYTETAMRRFGVWRGGWMGAARILRCHPWGGSGYDPVPDEVPVNARWYMPWRYGLWRSDHIDPSTRLDG
ncbi:membrane protein insertion efficiency factor YidD [Pseudovibrio exalbescens]|uniref:membrane protein insertion efficiency factor YidD n=1 Tax=Pseudovibrio exalbescens TaxID=197461 RepID=UPI000491FACF